MKRPNREFAFVIEDEHGLAKYLDDLEAYCDELEYQIEIYTSVNIRLTEKLRKLKE